LTERPSITLPLCVLGAGLVHGICIAVLLPVLVTDSGSATGEAGSAHVEAELSPQDETGQSLLATAEARHDAAEPPPELVTGSIVQAASSIASAIASMPREDLRQAEPVPATLASAAAWPQASLQTTAASGVVLVKADAMFIGAASPSAEELEAEEPPPVPITATDGESPAAEERSLARAEPAAAAPTRRKHSAPAPVVKAKPKPRPASKPSVAAVPKKRAAAPAQQAAPAATRQVQTRIRTTKQPTGLGLFFRKPQAARRPATRR
jgi:hypothetical protein